MRLLMAFQSSPSSQVDGTRSRNGVSPNSLLVRRMPWSAMPFLRGISLLSASGPPGQPGGAHDGHGDSGDAHARARPVAEPGHAVAVCQQNGHGYTNRLVSVANSYMCKSQSVRNGV